MIIDTISVPKFGRKLLYLMMTKDNHIYIYNEPIEIVDRWTQGSMMGGSRSRQIKMYNIKDYGETEGLPEYRMIDFMNRMIDENKVLIYDKKGFTKKLFRNDIV